MLNRGMEKHVQRIHNSLPWNNRTTWELNLTWSYLIMKVLCTGNPRINVFSYHSLMLNIIGEMSASCVMCLLAELCLHDSSMSFRCWYVPHFRSRGLTWWRHLLDDFWGLVCLLVFVPLRQTDLQACQTHSLINTIWFGQFCHIGHILHYRDK